MQRLFRKPFRLGNPQHGVGDSFRGRQPSVHRLKPVEQGVRIAIIIFVACRERDFLVRLVVAHFVAGVPQHVHDRKAALQQIGGAGQVAGEIRHVFPPGLSPEERRPDLVAEAGSRREEVHLRIVGIRVEHIVGDSLGHIQVGHFLEHLPVFVPGEVEGGETFRSHPALAVQVGGRRRGFDRLEVQVAHITLRERMPEFGHGDVGILVVFHVVHGDDVAAGGLVLHVQAFFVGEAHHFAEEVLIVQGRLHFPPVPEELRGGFRTAQHITGKGRKPRAEGVAGTGGEFGLHFAGPVLVAAFPAVHEHAGGLAPERTVRKTADIMGKLRPGASYVQFIAFPARRVCRGRRILVADVHVAVTEDGPIPFRGRPVEPAVRIHQAGQVQHGGRVHIAFSRPDGLFLVLLPSAQRAAGGCPPVILPRRRIKAQVGQVHRVLMGEGEAVLFRLRDFTQGQDKRFIVLPAGHGKLYVGHFPLQPVPADGPDIHGYAGRIAESVAQLLHGRHFQSTERGGRPESDRMGKRFFFGNTLFASEKGGPGGVGLDVLEFQG